MTIAAGSTVPDSSELPGGRAVRAECRLAGENSAPPAVGGDRSGDQLSPGLFGGYLRYEATPRPWLLWADGKTLRVEDLNPPGFSY